MGVIHVAASRSYDVVVDEDSRGIAALGAYCRGLPMDPAYFDRAFVVSDTNVAPLYLATVLRSLREAGFGDASSFVFEAGEASKTMATLERCLDAMAAAGLTRASVVVALGGGVVGDVAGLAAATYMRGCHCVQVPTSLLACIDSSVGGKNAVNLAAGKNLVGTFRQPDLVFVDTALMRSLPAHYFTDGCAEMLKYAVLFDEALFSILEAPLTSDDPRLSEVVVRCVELKRNVVEADEAESGARKLLNFGHTLGHAIERESSYSISHGFAVAMGMALVTRQACALGWCDSSLQARLERVLAAYGLPSTTAFSAEDIYKSALADKKRHGDAIDLVVPVRLGEARIVSMGLGDFKAFVWGALGD